MKLTKQEQNFLKDILKVMGKDDALNDGFAAALNMDIDKFNETADLVFVKLGNGRVVEG